MTRRPSGPRAALAVLLTASVLTACGGGPDDGGGDASPEPSATTSTASETASATAEPTGTGDSYLPVPDDLELDPPGTELPFGEAALVAWKPRQDVVGVVGVKVLKVQRTTVKRSLSGFKLDAAQKVSTVYFVSTLVGNGGDTDLGGRQLPMYVVDSQDRLVAPTGVNNAFKACPGSVLPAVFAPGDRARSCLIFLVPPDATLASVMFRPPEGVVPITWTGKVKPLPKSRPKAPAGDATAPAAG